jgi:hypothetical protein
MIEPVTRTPCDLGREKSYDFFTRAKINLSSATGYLAQNGDITSACVVLNVN